MKMSKNNIVFISLIILTYIILNYLIGLRNITSLVHMTIMQLGLIGVAISPVRRMGLKTYIWNKIS